MFIIFYHKSVINMLFIDNSHLTSENKLNFSHDYGFESIFQLNVKTTTFGYTIRT